MQLKKELTDGLAALHLNFSEQTQNQLLTYINLLRKWNRAYNLTAITDPHEILIQHIFDSLVITPYIKGKRILDVGTGAGLPGIPLALAFPEFTFVLLDSVGKKIRFLVQAVAELAIKNIEVVQARAEEFSPQQCFNTIVTRAVGSINDMIEKTRHVWCDDAELLIMKGVFPHQELEGITNAKVYPLRVPGLQKQRHLVCVSRNHK